MGSEFLMAMLFLFHFAHQIALAFKKLRLNQRSLRINKIVI